MVDPCTAIFGIIFDTLLSILIIAFTVALLRKFSGGAHATSPNRCTLISVIVLGAFSLLLKYFIPYASITLVILYNVISFIFTFTVLIKLCPVDSPNKPIRKQETRLKFRKVSFRILFFLFFLSVILWVLYLKIHSVLLLTAIASIFTGMLWQSLTMTYAGHLMINKLDIFIHNIKLVKGGKEG